MTKAGTKTQKIANTRRQLRIAETVAYMYADEAAQNCEAAELMFDTNNWYAKLLRRARPVALTQMTKAESAKIQARVAVIQSRVISVIKL